MDSEIKKVSPEAKKTDWQLVGKVILFVVGLAILGYLAWQLYSFIYKEDQNSAATVTTGTGQTKETKPACASTLTDADKNAMVGWKTYTNGTRKYVFKYPQTWWISRASEDHVILRENESKIEFSFKSASEAVPVTAGFTVTSSTSKQIACEPAAIKYYENGDLRLTVATFSKNGIDFVIQEKYEYLGASVGGDISDAWNLTLKSIEFN